MFVVGVANESSIRYAGLEPGPVLQRRKVRGQVSAGVISDGIHAPFELGPAVSGYQLMAVSGADQVWTTLDRIAEPPLQGVVV